MKKLLIASTALVASAGIAAAEVSVSGDGRMGVHYNSDETLGSSGDRSWSFVNRIRITFSATGETDTGLSFGGSIRADNASAGAASGGQGGDGTAGNVFISGAFGRLAMGDVNGGDEQVVGHLDGVGLTGLGDYNELAYSSDGNMPMGIEDLLDDLTVDYEGAAPARALYTYSMSGFTFAASHSQTGEARSMGVGVGYVMDGLSAALGYGEARDVWDDGITAEDVRIRDISASLGYSFGDFGVKVIGQQKRVSAGGDTVERHRSLGLSGTASFDMVDVTAYVMSVRARELDRTATSYGIGASYDLGGGASLVGGIARQADLNYVDDAVDTRTVADFGVSLRF